jgi:hypothetical protein
VGLVLTGIASFSVLGVMVYRAIQMVGSGRGLETYRTFWFVEFNWIGFLVLCGTIVIALAIALGSRLWEHLQWRALEKKYGSREGK